MSEKGEERSWGRLQTGEEWLLPSERRRLAEGGPNGERDSTGKLIYAPDPDSGLPLQDTAWSITKELDRRDFMLAAIGAVSLPLLGLLSAAPLARFFAAPPALSVEGRKPPGWVEVGKVSDFDENPKKVDYAGEYIVYVYKLEGKLVALSSVCQHLGCTTEWRPTATGLLKAKMDAQCEQPLFCCPCHYSEYDITGKVYSGSPAFPKNLPPQLIKLEGDKVWIGGNPPTYKATAAEGTSTLELGVKV